jgi:homopolymeric O-antigen transport system ATP-binding protein
MALAGQGGALETPVLVEVGGVGKKYCRSPRRALAYAALDGMRALLPGSLKTQALRPGEFWAVRDLSLQMRQGDCLGIAGPNGAGKSTLLKMLTGNVLANTGRIRVHGRIGAMIEAGAGLHPLLTGRENVFAWAQQQGYSAREAETQLAAVAAFAELGEFLDTPVKGYSSGMMVRLGFALIAHFPTEIVLLDEVLALSDARFRARCLNQIPLLTRRSAVVFVSHHMPQIARACNRMLVLDQGRAVYEGSDVARGINAYYAHCDAQAPSVASGTGRARLEEATLLADGREAECIEQGDCLTARLRLAVDTVISRPHLSLTLTTPDLQGVLQCDSDFAGFVIDNPGQPFTVSVDLGPLTLNPGVYFLSLSVSAAQGGEVLLRHDNVKKLRVSGANIGHAPFLLTGRWARDA